MRLFPQVLQERSVGHKRKHAIALTTDVSAEPKRAARVARGQAANAPARQEPKWSTMNDTLSAANAKTPTHCRMRLDKDAAHINGHSIECLACGTFVAGDAFTLPHGGGPGLGLAAVRSDLNAEFFKATRRWGPDLTVDKLIAEFPALLILVRASNFSTDISSADLAIRSEEARVFWLEHETDLPTWFHLVRIDFTVVPTSASVERLFSVFKRVFGELSEHAYEDFVALSVLLRYNTRGSH